MKCLAVLLALSSLAEAQTIRMASIVPEGTIWAREIHSVGYAVERVTKGAVRMKWYLGGIAGDDLQAAERIKKDQLDGSVSGAWCTHVAPSLRALEAVGLVQSRDEMLHLETRIKPIADEEFQRAGFVNLSLIVIGPVQLFTRTPVRDLAGLRRARLSVWSLDETAIAGLRELGVPAVPLPLDEMGAAYDAGRLDGILSVPQAALAWQWSTLTRYYTPIALYYIPGCMVMSQRTFDALPLEAQATIRVEVARAISRAEAAARLQDEALEAQLFERQGLTKIAVADSFRAELRAASQAVRERRALVPEALMLKVTGWLADFRAPQKARSR